ncbi:MAG: ABC transporter permease, partial [Gemmatimonadota bacterium]|nr:ABC transporter permease [Gemmatimonadota bacterium]
MSMFDGFRERLRPLFGRSGLQSEMDEELRFHFERQVEENLAAGMDLKRARRAAHASMGGAVKPAEDVRALWTGFELGGLGQEIALAARRLRRRPGFTIVAALTLALGIGANTAIFSLVRGVLVRPLPYLEPERIAFIWSPARDTETWLSAREYIEYDAALTEVAELATYTDFEVALTDDVEPERVLAAAVTTNAFSVLGIRPYLGRFFQREDDLPGANPVLVISHELWQRRYGGDEAIVGRTITANGDPATVIGVLPRGFRLPLDYRLERPTEVFGPSGIPGSDDLAWGSRGWFVYGRLADGATPESATADVHAVTTRWIEEGHLDESVGGLDREAVPLDDLLLAGMRAPLLLLMGAVGLILLIACANVAHLLLARSEARRGEVAIAAAMGASRLRLARQYLVENGLLATIGALLGVGIAAVALRVAVAVSPIALLRMREVELDGVVLAFAAGLTIGTTLIAGLLPAMRTTGVPLTAAIGGGRGADAAGGRGPMRRLLIALESALAVVLVIGAALLGRSF